MSFSSSCNPLPSVDLVLDHAHHASELLLHLRLQESVKVSRGVLDAILPMVSQQQQQQKQEQPQRQQPQHHHDESSSAQCFSVTLREMPSTQQQGLQKACRQDLDYFLPCAAVSFFDCPMEARRNFQNADSSSVASVYAALVSSLLYNIALSHHLQGLKSGSAKLCRKALALYRMAADRLSDFATVPLASSQEIVLVHLAVLHNMAHICAHVILDGDAVHACMAQSVYLLNSSNIRQPTTPSSNSNKNARLGFFLRNVRLCEACANQTSAPAA